MHSQLVISEWDKVVEHAYLLLFNVNIVSGKTYALCTVSSTECSKMIQYTIAHAANENTSQKHA